MKLKKNQKVFLIGKSIGRPLDEVLNKTVRMFDNKYFGYWQYERMSDQFGGLVNVIDYKSDTQSGDYYMDKDIVPIEVDIIPQELFEI